MKLVEIAALGQNRELGKDNDLIWNIREDLQFFARTTKGHPIVMGRKTFLSLPHILPGRHHIVITTHPEDLPEAVETHTSVEDFLRAWQDRDETVYVIGGASIYAQLLEQADALLLTWIAQSADADVYFPAFDETLYARKILMEQKEESPCYARIQYVRKGKTDACAQ